MEKNDEIMDLNEILRRIKFPNTKEDSGEKNNTRYQYKPTLIEYVMEHPEEYIIPECIDCCELLWSKGIDTFQCGNYDDPIENGFWIEIDTSSLSKDNKHILDEISKGDSRVFYCVGLQLQHNYIIRVSRINNPNASQELCDIANNLMLQDTSLYTPAEDILDRYKRVGGELKLTETGFVYYEINPERENATLADALKTIEHPELYIAEEGRLYHS